jgi:tRNA-dihydrouridine synthase B
MSAPMYGVMDSATRQIIRTFSSNKELLFTQMMNPTSFVNKKLYSRIKIKPIEYPLALQIFTHDTKMITDEITKKVLEKKFTLINLNVGCPSKKVVGSGSGSYLMATPKKLAQIIKSLETNFSKELPVTVKIRAGFKEKNAVDISMLAQDNGAEMIIIHPRTQEGAFSAALDFELVEKVKKSVSIPVIFSGDIKNLADAKTTYEKTGVDGFMIGNALWGSPWKLKEILHDIKNEKFEITFDEVINCTLKHLDLSIDLYGEHGINPFKKHLVRYLKHICKLQKLYSHAKIAAEFNVEFLKIKSYAEIKNKLEQFKR